MSTYQDLYVDDDDDFVFTEDGDIQLAEDCQVVAQDVKEGVMVGKGDLLWAPSAGKGLRNLVKDNDVSDETVISYLRSEAIEDIRINPDTVVAGKNKSTGKFFLVFVCYGSVDEQELLFDKKDLLGE